MVSTFDNIYAARKPRHTLCTRLVYAALPAPYTEKTFYDLLADWVADLNALSSFGISAAWIEDLRGSINGSWMCG